MKKITQFGKTKLVVLALLFALILSCLVGIIVVNNGADAASADTTATTKAVDNEAEEDWSPTINPLEYSKVSMGQIYTKKGSAPATYLSQKDFGDPNSTYGTASFSGKTATVTKTQLQWYTYGYVTFKAETTIPAYTEYSITYNYTLYKKRSANNSGSTITTMTEFIYFGNIDKTSTYTYSRASTLTANGVAKIYNTNNSAATKTGSFTVTYVNKTEEPVLSTDYFSLFAGSTSGSTYKAALNSYVTLTDSIKAKPVTVDDPIDVTAEYDGENWYEPSRFEGLESDLFYWYNEGIIDLKLVDHNVMVDVGKYEITASLTNKANRYHVKWTDGTTDAKTFIFTVAKKKITIVDFDLDDDYLLEEVYHGGVLAKDKNTEVEPVFGVRYYKSGSDMYLTNPPADVASFIAEVYIINSATSFYQIDTTTNYARTVIVTKDNVTAPWVICSTEDSKWDNSSSTLTTPYTGDFQNFKLVNADNEELVGIKIADVIGSMTYDENTLSARNVSSDYVIKLELSNTHNYQWYDHESDPSEYRFVFVEITSAHLTVNVEGGNEARKWNKGQCNELTVTVSGVIGGDQVKIDVYYLIGRGIAKNYIGANDIEPVNENGEIVAHVRLNGLDISEYTLFVTLRSGVTANSRYALWDKANAKEIDAYTYAFELEETIVVIENFDWKYYIGLNNEEYYDWHEESELFFTGNEYVFNLFIDGVNAVNVAGIEVSYATYIDDSVLATETASAYSYATIATVTLMPGYVFGNAETAKIFELDWEVMPIMYDVSNLEWDVNPTYSGLSQTMSIVNALSWMDINYNFNNYYNKRIDAGEYVAKAVIDFNQNCTFYVGENSATRKSSSDNSFENTAVTINDDGSVTLEHTWSIVKQRLNVAASGWTTVTYSDENGETYEVPVPKFVVGKEGLFDISFYNDSRLTDEVDKDQIIVRYGENGAQYFYAKIELTETAAKNFSMYRGSDEIVGISKSFQVGDDRLDIELEFSFGEVQYVETEEGYAVAFEGAVANFTITASNREVPAEFDLTYYTYDESQDDGEGSCLDDVPTEEGEYLMKAKFADQSFENDYVIKNDTNRLSVKASAKQLEQLKPAPDKDPDGEDDPNPNGDEIDPNSNEGTSGNLGGNVIVNGMTEEQFTIMLVSIVASVLFLGALIIVFMILYSKSRAAKEAAAQAAAAQTSAQTADPEQMAQMQSDIAAMRAQMAVGAVGLGVGAAGGVKKVRPRISSNKVIVKFPTK